MFYLDTRLREQQKVKDAGHGGEPFNPPLYQSSARQDGACRVISKGAKRLYIQWDMHKGSRDNDWYDQQDLGGLVQDFTSVQY